jgi:hypothetical protein
MVIRERVHINFITKRKLKILTKNFERLFHPEIGCQVNSLMFENLDNATLASIKYTIENVIKNFEPRVRISSITAIPSPDESGYKIRLEFFVINNPDPITINFFLERIR